MTCFVAPGKLKRSRNKVTPNEDALDCATTTASPAVYGREGRSCSPVYDGDRRHEGQRPSANNGHEHVRRELLVKTAWAESEPQASTSLRSRSSRSSGSRGSSGGWCGSPAAAAVGVGLPTAAVERRSAAISDSSPLPQADSQGFESGGRDRCLQQHVGGRRELATAGRISLPQVVACATIWRLRSSSSLPPPPPETLLGQPVSSQLKIALSNVACLEAKVKTDEAMRQQIERFRTLRAAQRQAVVEEAIRGMDWQNVPIRAWKTLKETARRRTIQNSQDSQLDGQVRGDPALATITRAVDNNE